MLYGWCTLIHEVWDMYRPTYASSGHTEGADQAVRPFMEPFRARGLAGSPRERRLERTSGEHHGQMGAVLGRRVDVVVAIDAIGRVRGRIRDCVCTLANQRLFDAGR